MAPAKSGPPKSPVPHSSDVAAGPPPVVERVAAAFAAELARPLAPGLYLTATPIGHLADITLRALAVLARADVIYCEDTRHSRKLLGHYAISRPLRPYHEHNAAEVRPHILADLAAGRVVALISDAGTPLVSDPGFKLVRDVVAADRPVFALPGPSAVLAGLLASALPTDCFLFAGFLPPRSAARRTRIAELAGAPGTLILFESANRLAESLADLAEGLGPRAAAVARELTKLHEEVRRGALGELAEWALADPPQGEIVVLIEAAPARERSDREITEFLERCLATQSVRDAADRAASELEIPKKRAYALALAIKNDRAGGGGSSTP